MLSLTAADPRVCACAGAPSDRRAAVVACERFQATWNRSSPVRVLCNRQCRSHLVKNRNNWKEMVMKFLSWRNHGVTFPG